MRRVSQGEWTILQRIVYKMNSTLLNPLWMYIKSDKKHRRWCLMLSPCPVMRQNLVEFKVQSFKRRSTCHFDQSCGTIHRSKLAGNNSFNHDLLQWSWNQSPQWTDVLTWNIKRTNVFYSTNMVHGLRWIFYETLNLHLRESLLMNLSDYHRITQAYSLLCRVQGVGHGKSWD